MTTLHDDQSGPKLGANQFDGYFNHIIEQISESLASLDNCAFEACVRDCADVIRNGGKIVASGLGKNEPICEKFVGTMTSLGLRSAFMNTNSAMHGDLGYIKKEDLVLILSKSGNTFESIELFKYIQEWDCRKWLLSFNNGGELGRIVDKKILLKLSHEGDPWNLVPNNSTSIYLIVLQGLALHLAEILGVQLDEFRLNHPGGAIGRTLHGGGRHK